jgi:hypothetical protein
VSECRKNESLFEFVKKESWKEENLDENYTKAEIETER